MKGTAVLSVAILVAAMAVPGPTRADDNVPDTLFTPEVQRSVDRGLEWLASRQNENGSWSCVVGYKLNEGYETNTERAAAEHVCVTALAGMAFLAHGDVPGQGRYGQVIEKALDFVLANARDSDGYITKNGTRMYEHAFCTMFLAEIYGMSRRMDVGEKLRGAVRCILNAQNNEGGWRYQPTPVDADISVTVSTLQALRAARNVGISVPRSSIDSAVRYIKGCANDDGSFSYQINRGMTRSTFPLTACGIVALHSAGEYTDRQVDRGIRWLQRNRASMEAQEYHFMYGHYYAVQAFYVAGGRAFEDYYSDISRRLMSRQEADGHWVDDVGQTYATAMACVILQVPCHYLPIFQK
ncbi:MAG: terpene cyclase/mutase family protein [Planctomycetia bacterium]|nr:terpene cyclase/mutase family protein [Planctomycetia bacterium]